LGPDIAKSMNVIVADFGEMNIWTEKVRWSSKIASRLGLRMVLSHELYILASRVPGLS